MWQKRFQLLACFATFCYIFLKSKLINPWQNQRKWLCFSTGKTYRRSLRENADHALQLLHMGIHALYQDPQNSKKTALNDREAKRLLEKFDIVMVPERFVRRQSEVVAAARKIGFPVVLKGTGANLLTKPTGAWYISICWMPRLLKKQFRKSPPKQQRNWKGF